MKALADTLKDLAAPTTSDSVWTQACFSGSGPADLERWRQSGGKIYNGKVRDLVITPQKVLMIHSDRLSAFDRFIGYVPFKGVILTHICRFWFDSLRQVVPNHFRSSPHDRVLEVEPLTPVKTEVVVRGYLAGSIMRAYDAGEREFCGVKLPDGLRAYQKLPEPIITPTTKAAAFEHDENTNAADLIANGVCSAAEWQTITTMAFRVFQHGQTVFAKAGWILADTKYEFGRDASGGIKLMDEVHTPDSSRLWESATYAGRCSEKLAPIMLDKENIRRFLMDQGFSGHGPVPQVPRAEFIKLALIYLHVLEALTGEKLQVNPTKAQTLTSIL